MPQPVAQRRHAPLVVARELAALLVDVGDVGEGRVEPQLRTAHRRVGALLERTEIAREGELLFVTDVLAGQHQHGVPVHAGVDRVDFVRRQRPARVDVRHAAADMGRERMDFDWHGQS